MIISIHALLAESDTARPYSPRNTRNFYPRSPCGERRPEILSTLFVIPISIHALLAESDIFDAKLSFPINISIHALLAESDLTLPALLIRQRDFYPRSPCGERRFCVYLFKFQALFLSTLSLRRATGSTEERPLLTVISIHALLAESDPSGQCTGRLWTGFLSTLSLRRAT